MNKKTIKLILKYFSFTAIFFLFCGFQVSFWPEIISFLPAPPLWLIFIVFITLKWPPLSTAFYIYFIGYIATLFSSIPLKMVWISYIFLFLFAWLFKKRFHSASLYMFSIMCTISYLFYSLIYISVSYWLEQTPTSLYVLIRFLEMGLTFLLSSSIYLLLNKVDTYFRDTEIWTAQQTSLSKEYDPSELS